MTIRTEEIKQWLTSYFPNIDLNNLQYIQADASDRKYLRLILNDASYIVMDTKPGPELDNFIKIAMLFTAHGVHVPEIIQQDVERGLLLMSDLGSATYLSVLKDSSIDTVTRIYVDALKALIKIQKIPDGSSGVNLARMDAAYISNRLDVFTDWYLKRHLNINPDAQVLSMLADLQNLFEDCYNELPAVTVHLDYHSRNLMYQATSNNPGIIDFQDAMFGPPTYDLVSLFQDAYITWPRTQVEAWVELYAELAINDGLILPLDTKSLLRNFDMVGLQRHIKNLGIFARLHYRDHKSNYLNDIPTLLKYITTTCARYSELTPLLEFLKGHILEVAL